MTDIILSPDEREAESRKYGHGIKMILPLSSGSFAVFDHRRKLLAIVDSIYARTVDDRPDWLTFVPDAPPAKPPGIAALDTFLKEISIDDIG